MGIKGCRNSVGNFYFTGKCDIPFIPILDEGGFFDDAWELSCLYEFHPANFGEVYFGAFNSNALWVAKAFIHAFFLESRISWMDALFDFSEEMLKGVI